ncbi:MAG: hypothetical protein WBG19_03745 [Thermoplasmata archaeon]
MRRASRVGIVRPALALFAVVLLIAVEPSAHARSPNPAGGATGSSRDLFGTIPIALDRQFLGNLSVPSLAPGGSTELRYSLEDPTKMAGSLTRVVLTFQVYAFNGYPGDASALLPVANSPVLSNTTASGSTVTVSTASLATGASLIGSIGISTSTDTPAGTFAIRTAIAFELTATSYLLESRGWFSASVWASATEAPNGTATLNLSRLGVSGLLPETAVLVASSDWAWALGALLAGAFVLLAAGAWFYYSRRGPGSSSGVG